MSKYTGYFLFCGILHKRLNTALTHVFFFDKTIAHIYHHHTCKQRCEIWEPSGWLLVESYVKDRESYLLLVLFWYGHWNEGFEWKNEVFLFELIFSKCFCDIVFFTDSTRIIKTITGWQIYHRHQEIHTYISFDILFSQFCWSIRYCLSRVDIRLSNN